jgi:prepilin-type N-terminal cleavage/methylation domain-containing protein
MKRATHRAFTLLEVVVALVLMGTLVATSIVSLAAYKKQMQFSQQRVTAVRLADEILTRWYELKQGPPFLDRGVIESDGTWSWRTQPVRVQRLFGQEVTVIRFDLLSPQEQQRKPTVMVSVELLWNPT